MSFLLFIVGLAFTLWAHYPVKWFLAWVRTKSGVPPDRPGAGVPNWIVGAFERLFAFGVVLADVENAYAVLIAWMAAKLAANWQRPTVVGDSAVDREVRVYGISALMAGTLSLSLAVIGATIARLGCQ